MTRRARHVRHRGHDGSSERVESFIPSVGIEKTRVGGTLTLTTPKTEHGERASLALEAALRRDVYDEERDSPSYDASVGLRLGFTWNVWSGAIRSFADR